MEILPSSTCIINPVTRNEIMANYDGRTYEEIGKRIVEYLQEYKLIF